MSGVQPDHCSTCGDLVASGEKYLEIEGKLSVVNSVLAMAVARLGGEVAGSPTHRGNFLQRIDELRTLERDLAAAREENARLREALEDVALKCGSFSCYYVDEETGLDELTPVGLVAEIAIRALDARPSRGGRRTDR